MLKAEVKTYCVLRVRRGAERGMGFPSLMQIDSQVTDVCYRKGHGGAGFRVRGPTDETANSPAGSISATLRRDRRRRSQGGHVALSPNRLRSSSASEWIRVVPTFKGNAEGRRRNAEPFKCGVPSGEC